MEQYERKPDYRLRRASVALLVVLIEVVEIPLFANAFGEEIVALLAVRMLLTMVVGSFFIRPGGHDVARVLLGALRILAFCVGVVMAVDAHAWALLAVSLLDGGAAIALFRMRFWGPEEHEGLD